MAHTISSLKKLSKEELIKEHDSHANSTMVGVGYYLDELRYREQNEFADKIEVLTKQMKLFTIVASVATVVSAVLTAWALFRF